MLFWFSLSLTCSLFFALMALRIAFGAEYVVQDDVRQHVFWMSRFVDPAVLPGDLIADYFQSVAPEGYTTLYRLLAAIGIDPLFASKLLPIGLGLITTAYCFGACLQLLPIPFAGFLASLLLNQNLIMADDLNSATPRAFLYPLFLAFLYYLLRRYRKPDLAWTDSLLPCSVTIALLGLFYPQLMLVAAGVLVLSVVDWQAGRLRLSRKRTDYLFYGGGLAVAAIVLVVYVTQGGSEFGPAMKASVARTMPEFWRGGRGAFFSDDPFSFWLFSGRSGILPHPNQLLKPPLLLAGGFLPLLLRRSMRFPLAQQVTHAVRVLPLTVLSSIGLFGIAHILLFRLHHPSRYMQHSLRVVLALAAGIALTLLLDSLLRTVLQSNQSQQRLKALTLAAALGIILLVYPGTSRFKDVHPLFEWFVPSKMLPGYVEGKVPELYKFFAQQPKDSLIASLDPEADNIPTFARRSILVGREYGIPYHVGYYRQFRERSIDLIRAQYSSDLNQVREFTQKYGIDFWLLDRDAFTPAYLATKPWIQQYQPDATNAATTLKQGTVPVLQASVGRCSRFETASEESSLVVLDANCVVELSPSRAQ